VYVDLIEKFGYGEANPDARDDVENDDAYVEVNGVCLKSVFVSSFNHWY
jgi:hypothetical protein